MRKILVFLCLVLCGSAIESWSETENQDRVFVIEVHVFAVDDEEGQGVMVIEPDRGFRPRPDTLVVLEDEQRIRVGRLIFSVEPTGEILANGNPLFAPQAGVTMISSPRVTTQDGSLATIRTGFRSGVQYLDRQPDGTFLLMTSAPDPAAGMEIEVTPRAPADHPAPAEEIDLEYRLKTTFLLGRVKYPDVDLEIGEPVFQTRTAETRLRVPLNRWMLLQSIRAKEENEGPTTELITMMRVIDMPR